MEYNFGGEWRIQKKITHGSFGEIFKGININTQEEVAIKLEPFAGRSCQIFREAKVLKSLEPALGFPKVRWFGKTTGFNILILDLLGPSLQDLFDLVKKKLSLKSVLMIAEQLISRIQVLHSFHFLHRDIKPENILIGREKNSDLIYMIDFGLAKRYKDSQKKHIEHAEDKGFIGNQRFCSNNALLGIEQSRRDDLEAIGYVLIYFLKGKLPWEGLKPDSGKSKKKFLIQHKVQLPLEVLCDDCPDVFYTYMAYVKSLPFKTKPDYAYLKKIFRDYFIKSEYSFDNLFEWKLLKVLTHSNSLVSEGKKTNRYLLDVKEISAVRSKKVVEEKDTGSCIVF